MLAIIILLIGILSRFIYHTPNFTPVLALALFGGTYLKKKYALLVPLSLMIVSDLLIGMHELILFTWGSVALIAAMGLWLRRHKTVYGIAGCSVAAALGFFLITNIGAWLVMYPLTIEGLRNCYVAAIPFYRQTFFSTLVYSAGLFGLYELIAVYVRKTRYADWLLAT